MICKTIKIDGRDVNDRASAMVPRLYRFKFSRDIMHDMQLLKKAYDDTSNNKEFGAMDLEIFENVAYIMAKHAE